MALKVSLGSGSYDATQQLVTIAGQMVQDTNAPVALSFTVRLDQFLEAEQAVADWVNPTLLAHGLTGPVLPAEVARFLALAYALFNMPPGTSPQPLPSAWSMPDVSV